MSIQLDIFKKLNPKYQTKEVYYSVLTDVAHHNIKQDLKELKKMKHPAFSGIDSIRKSIYAETPEIKKITKKNKTNLRYDPNSDEIYGGVEEFYDNSK
jgi:hypothetical protein